MDELRPENQSVDAMLARLKLRIERDLEEDLLDPFKTFKTLVINSGLPYIHLPVKGGTHCFDSPLVADVVALSELPDQFEGARSAALHVRIDGVDAYVCVRHIASIVLHKCE